jgi:hypothetical protein
MNEAKLNDFMGKLVTDMGGAAMLANMILGDELGLYRAMADGQPVTPEALADKTGCNARLLREWLSAQAASGYMEHRDGQFRLPEEQAMALAIEDSPVYVAGGASVVAALFHDKDKMASAMRGNGALAWGAAAPSASSVPVTGRIWWLNGYRPWKAWSINSTPAPRWRISAADMAPRP